jgi:hypothetical protein
MAESNRTPESRGAAREGDRREKGARGGVGPVGEQGDKGPKGGVGPVGEQGDKGPVGEQGERGDKGPVGEQGERGDKGPTGGVGPVGEQGERGDKGIAGPQGPQGEQGPAGRAGPPGLPGVQPGRAWLDQPSPPELVSNVVRAAFDVTPRTFIDPRAGYRYLTALASSVVKLHGGLLLRAMITEPDPTDAPADRSHVRSIA